MHHYLISFTSATMSHIPDDELPSVAESAHAVIREAKAAGVYVFGGDIDESVAPVLLVSRLESSAPRCTVCSVESLRGVATRHGGPASKVERVMSLAKFRMGRLDHVHIRVPDREAAARWYADNLGFEPVQDFEFWANGFEGGPLQISADGGKTMLALFEASEGHPLAPQVTGVAFSVDADSFKAFARSLPNGINSPTGRPLQINDVVDLDMCWAYNFVDPWGNHFELNCYEYQAILAGLIVADDVEPVRYWPRELYQRYQE